MGRGRTLSISVPLLKRHMEEEGVALTSGETTQLLDMSISAALGVLDIMEAKGIVQCVRRRKNFYFLKDTYDEERIETMILEADERTQSVTGSYSPSSRRSKYDPMIDRFLEIEQDLVTVEVEGKNPSYIVGLLNRRIKRRGLNIVASSSGGFVYLEKA